jgi:hypothetical protein
MDNNLVFVLLCTVTWGINIGLLSFYIHFHGAELLNMLTLVFVVLTGLIPMLRGLVKTAINKRYSCEPLWSFLDIGEGWAFFHTVSGIISTAFSGLLLGHAAQCGQDSYDHIDLLIWAAVVNGLSGISAHFGFIDSDKIKALYDEEGTKSWAYLNLNGNPWFGNFHDSRLAWYFITMSCSGVSLILHAATKYENTSTSCVKESKLLEVPILLWSPIIHTIAFAIMVFVTHSVKDLLHIINLPVMHITAILSMFNVMYSFGQAADWFIVIPVYIYLGMAHLEIS